MKVGDKVRHKTKDWIGIVHSFHKYVALIDWSDELGIRFRKARVEHLEVINENR